MGPDAFLSFALSIKSDIVAWGLVLLGVKVFEYGVRIIKDRMVPLASSYKHGSDDWRYERDYRYWELRNDRT
jgi:hypothetical protein